MGKACMEFAGVEMWDDSESILCLGPIFRHQHNITLLTFLHF